MKYLLKQLKDKFELEKNDLKFSELNYEVGNTAGMDVAGGVPSELALRVGSSAQRGGGEMEIQITNPTSFHVDREALYTIVQQLGLDISIHSEPNVGYTSAYKTGQGRGFDPTHEYFTKYLQEFASWKTEAESREDLTFNISRINPHASTDERPALQERMEQDVGLDPFGLDISDLSDERWEERDNRGINIYRNKKFLRGIYRTLFLREARFPFEQYSTFAAYSEKFDNFWKDAQQQASYEIFVKETGPENYPELKDQVMTKLSTTQSILVNDQGLTLAWREIVNDTPLDNELKLPQTEELELDSASTLSELNRVTSTLGGVNIFELRKLTEYVYSIEENALTEILRQENTEPEKTILKALRDALNNLWNPNKFEDSNISIDGKMRGLTNHLEIQQLRIIERAYDIGLEGKSYRVNGDLVDIEEAAERVFSGDPEMYETQDDKGPEARHVDMVKRILQNQQFQRQMWQESVIFYQVMPVWMKYSSEQEKSEAGDIVHRGFEAPRFIWETLVERKWGSIEFEDNYFERLESSLEFREDVAAATGACYIWSHFTQVKSRFNVEDSWLKEGLGLEEEDNIIDEIEEHGWSWVRWMNEFGIGVNIEAMAGSSNQVLKVWKPKDIVAACRAINITARNHFNEIHEDLDDCPAKFTIDMEHTASFGTDPWLHMEDLIEQEKWLADSEWAEKIPVNKEKPLAKMVRMYHLTKPGFETTQGVGHLHGPFREGDVQLYTWLYKMVANGFCQNPGERASIMYEIGGDQMGTVRQARLTMNMIELGLSPDDLDPAKIDPGKEYQSEEDALMARFFGMDLPSFNREWAKIENHAFDPLKGLLETPEFDYTFSSLAAIKNDNNPGEFQNEEYR